MTLFNKIKVINRMYIKRVYITILLLVMNIMAFFMTDQIWNEYFVKVNSVHHMYKAYSISPYNINKLTFGVESKADERIRTLEGLKKIDTVVSSGSFTATSITNLSGINNVDVIICDYDLTEMCNIDIKKYEIEKLYSEWGDLEPVLLGCNYKNKINIGERFTIYGYECVVAGFLSAGSEWIINENNSVDFYDLKNVGLLLTKHYDRYCMDEIIEFVTPIYYICSYEDKTITDRKIIEYMNSNGIRAGISNDGEYLEEYSENNSFGDNKKVIAAILLYVIDIISVSAVTIMESEINRRDYAIFVINGFSVTSVSTMIIIKNVIITLFGAVFAWLFCQLRIFGNIVPPKELFVSSCDYYYELISHCMYVPLIIIAEIIIIIILSCIVPIVNIKKMNLVETLKKR